MREFFTNQLPFSLPYEMPIIAEFDYYLLGSNGIYRGTYIEPDTSLFPDSVFGNPGYLPLPQPIALQSKIVDPVVGDDGIAIGPDGLLYVTNSQSKEIRRYNSDGGFVDVFLSAADLGMTPQSMQFGPNGDLYTLGVIEVQNDLDIPVIKRFDVDTSQFVSETQFDPYYAAIGWVSDGLSGFNDRFYIIGVPEPTSFTIISLLGIGLLFRPSHGCQLV
jgi:hypothetical protein